MFAISNTISTVGGIISSTTGPKFTKNGTPGEWQLILIVCAVFYFLGGLLNTLFSNSDVQPWALLDNGQASSENKPANSIESNSNHHIPLSSSKIGFDKQNEQILWSEEEKEVTNDDNGRTMPKNRLNGVMNDKSSRLLENADNDYNQISI